MRRALFCGIIRVIKVGGFWHMSLFVLIVFVILLVIALGFGYYFTDRAIAPKTRTHEETIEREFQRGILEKDHWDELPKEALHIMTPRGYELFAYWIPSKESNKTIIFVHGITYTLYGGIKYMMPFIKKGYNVLLYDHRNHGRSGGNLTTFGFYEKLDLMCVVDEVLSLVPENKLLATHGESMGAATVIQHAAIDSRVDYVISDCSFSSAWEEFEYRLKVEKNLPSFPVLHLASIFSYLRTGVFFSQMSPKKYVDKIQVPILFFHGAEDDYVPTAHSKMLYEIKKEPKALCVVENAKHAHSVIEDRERYFNEIDQFLASNGFN